MANLLAGEVEAKALGRVFVFSFRMGALVGAQHDLGIEDADVATVLSKLVAAADRFEGRLILLHNALKVHNPELTREQAAEIVTEIGLREANNLIMRGFIAAWPEKKTGAWTKLLKTVTPGTTTA